MTNKLPKFQDKHKICIICEGNKEYEYLNRLKELKVWNEQYDISLVNAGGNGNIPARYQDRYQNGTYEVVLIFCDTEKKPHACYYLHYLVYSGFCCQFIEWFFISIGSNRFINMLYILSNKSYFLSSLIYLRKKLKYIDKIFYSAYTVCE